MNILVIGPSWVGDMVMSQSLYKTLKIQHPNCEIDVLAPNWCKPLLERMPEVRKAITMPIGHKALEIKTRYQIGKALRNQYDMAIILPNSFKSAFIPLFAKIPLRRGWKGESRYFILNDLRPNKKDYPMMVQRYVALGYDKNHIPSANNLRIENPTLSYSEQEILLTKQHFSEQLKHEGDRHVIGFCPGAEFGPAKRWPHYHYANLAKLLIEKEFAVRIFGSPKDHAVGEEIIQSLPKEAQPFCCNLAGATTLNQAVDLIADCQAIVSNDSGLMHIAAAVNRPLVALYGPTSPTYTPPLSDKAIIIRLIEGGLIKIRKGTDSSEGYHQSLIDIQPEMVWASLSLLLLKKDC